jgi:hypothetical protein
VTQPGLLAHREGATKEQAVPGAAPVLAGRDLAGGVIPAAARPPPRDWCAPIIAQRGDASLRAQEPQRGLRQASACLCDGAWPPW